MIIFILLRRLQAEKPTSISVTTHAWKENKGRVRSANGKNFMKRKKKLE